MNIPVIHVKGENLPEAWERAIVKLYRHGIETETEYDNEKTTHKTLEATMIVEVLNPFNEPRIHKNICGGPEELEVYRQEVVYGIHDNWITKDKGKDNHWLYTYHNRIFHYTADKHHHVNQVKEVTNKLTEVHFSRRAQAITWMPYVDNNNYDCPCLQRLWFKITEDIEGYLYLNMNSHWRSRDAYKAWFMNAYALTSLQSEIADMLTEKIGQKVHIGRYVDISDSFHLYGSYFEEAEPEIKKMIANPNYLERAWNSNYSAFVTMTEISKANIKKELNDDE